MKENFKHFTWFFTDTDSLCYERDEDPYEKNEQVQRTIWSK